jgi:hypothetical protein
VECPHCGLNVITFIEHEASWVTYLVSIVLLLVLNWAALCVVPVTYPLFKDVVHHCPRCLSVLAVRSRVVLPSFRNEVMSFRFGSCVVVLARKYVVVLLCFMACIGAIHYARSSGPTPSGLDALQRTEVVSLGWEDFVKDCGFKSYLGNPIHVTMAFNENYKNKTFHWQGGMHHYEQGLNFLMFNQRGAVYVRMDPAQFPMKRDAADLVLLYNSNDNKVGQAVEKMKRGDAFGFEATMVEVGRRGAPHVMFLWEIFPAEHPSTSALGAAAAPPEKSEAGMSVEKSAAERGEAAAKLPINDTSSGIP